MESWLSEPAETWFGAAMLLLIAAVTIRGAFRWRLNGRMDLFLALMRDWPADDVREGVDKPIVADCQAQAAEAARRKL
jgi:hypothetical protein